MKKIQATMLMLLVAVLSLTVQSCGSDSESPKDDADKEVYRKVLKIEGANVIIVQ